MRYAALFLVAIGVWAQQRPDVNYDEAKVPAYTLPDVLAGVHGARDWPARRQQILEMYRTEVFGRGPGKPRGQQFQVAGVDRAALGGRAVRKLVTISFGSGPQIAHAALSAGREEDPACVSGPLFFRQPDGVQRPRNSTRRGMGARPGDEADGEADRSGIFARALGGAVAAR
jgi:hypothetical protein